jgi:hypothetical protein
LEMKTGKGSKSLQITRLARKVADVLTNTKGNGNSGREDHTALAPISDEQIKMRAYELFLAREGSHGDDWRDWFLAERELAGKNAA